MARKAFVTGATGFLGLTLVEELVKQGWQVTALHRSSSDLRFVKRFPVDLVEGDVTERASLDAIEKGTEAVFHVAGDVNLWSRRNRQQDRVNIEGTRNVVEASLNARVGRLIHTSTISVYGLQVGRISEASEMRGDRSWINYQRSKFFAEREVRRGIEQGLDAVILNPASIIGAYDTTSWARFFRLLGDGALAGAPPGSLSFCHSREVARAHIAAFDKGATGENYLLGGTDATFLQLLETMADLMGLPRPSRVVPPWILKLSSRAGQLKSLFNGRQPTLTPEVVAMVCRRMTCDCRKAIEGLGFRIVDLRSMVGDSYEWLLKEGLLDS